MATQTLSIERSQAGLSFLLQWILAFTVSFAVGGAVGKAFGMRAGFVVSGLIIIGLQWLVLRKQVPQAGLLALAGATGSPCASSPKASAPGCWAKRWVVL